jgi:hypothetical protein
MMLKISLNMMDKFKRLMISIKGTPNRKVTSNIKIGSIDALLTFSGFNKYSLK